MFRFQLCVVFSSLRNATTLPKRRYNWQNFHNQRNSYINLSPCAVEFPSPKLETPISAALRRSLQGGSSRALAPISRWQETRNEMNPASFTQLSNLLHFQNSHHGRTTYIPASCWGEKQTLHNSAQAKTTSPRKIQIP